MGNNQQVPEINLLEAPKRGLGSKLKNWWVRRRRNLLVALGLGVIVAGGLYYYLQLNLPGESALTKLAKRLTNQQTLMVDGEFTKLTLPDREPPFFTLTTPERSRFGILPSTTFTLTAREPLPEGLVEDLLTASVPVTVEQTAADTYEITPTTTLGKNERVVFSMETKDVSRGEVSFDRDYSWAFQTQGDFRVVSEIPGDQRTNVPVNAGIEIKFSQDDFIDPTNFVAVSPQIEYRLERHDETLAIVPLTALELQTTYTVTLKKGLNLESRDDPIEEDYVFAFQTASAATAEQKPYLTLADSFIQVTPRDQAQAKVYSYRANEIKVKTTTFLAPSTTAFIGSRLGHDKYQYSWQRYYAEAEPVDTSGWQKVFEAEISVSQQNGLEYLELPQALPEGKYLVVFEYGDNQKEYLWVQSSFISAYTTIGRKESLAWVNSLDEATTIELASVSLWQGGGSYPIGEDGVGVFATPQQLFDKRANYLLIRNNDGKELILPAGKLTERAGPTEKTANDYWSYLYQERRIYKPDDTVHFWGVVKDRDNNAAPGNVTVRLEDELQTITPKADGSLIGSFKLEGVDTGSYRLGLWVDEVEVTSSYFYVENYVKPEMKIEVVTKNKAAFAGETVDYEILATFYDGTPVAKMDLMVSTQYNDEDATVTTDSNGRATFAYKSKYTPENMPYRTYPRYETITVTPQSSQDASIEGFGSVYVYGPKIGLETDSTQEGETALVRGMLYRVDLEGLNAGVSQEVRGAPLPNHKVKLQVEKSWWERIESGTYYDYVEKVTRPQYIYTQHKEIAAETELTTNNDGQLSYDFKMEAKKSYLANLTTADSEGRGIWSTDYFYYYPDSSQNRDQNQQAQLKLRGEENEFGLDETVEMEIGYGEELYPKSDKTKFLYTLANRGKQSYTVSSDPTLTFEFTQDKVPNVSVGAMIFNGKHYSNVTTYCQWQWNCYDFYYMEEAGYPFSGVTVKYDESESELDLKIVTSEETYQPGEEVAIEVEVSHNGEVVPGASVQLVLVDQALEALGGVRVPTTLSSLYAHVPHDIYYRYFSHQPLLPDAPAAEKGGGGGGRDLFKDTPFFGTAESDENGKARFSFTLADDITTFNVYAQAVTSDLEAGQQTAYLPVTKDFFVTSNFPREILTGDEVKLAGNSWGRALKEGDKIDFEMVVETESEAEKLNLTRQGEAYRELVFDLPRLELGNYRTILRGKFGEYEDGLVYPLRVDSTRMDLITAERYEVNAGETVNQLAGPFDETEPVTLRVTDAGKSQYFFDLLRIGACESNRLEKKIARSRASELMEKYFEWKLCGGEDELSPEFQTGRGGLSQVKWGGEDLETTIWAILVAPDSFDKDRLKDYLREELDEEQAGIIDQAYATWGLTILGEPELLTLNQLKETAVNFEERVVIALALVSGGDAETARELYLDILADMAYEKKPYIRIQDKTSDQDPEAFITNTGYALLLSSLIGDDYSRGMKAYLNDYEHQADEVVTDLAEMAFMENELVKAPAQVTEITWTVMGQTIREKLEYGQAFGVSLRNDQVNNFFMEVNSGKAEAVFEYTIPSESIGQLDGDERLTLKREWSKAVGEGQVMPGDVVRVTLNFNVDKAIGPRGGYTITDHLPSGWVLIDRPQLYGLTPVGYVYQEDHNVVKTTFYNSDWWHEYGRKQVTYFVRAVAPGKYGYEPAVMQAHQDWSVMQLTGKDEVIIGERN